MLNLLSRGRGAGRGAGQREEEGSLTRPVLPEGPLLAGARLPSGTVATARGRQVGEAGPERCWAPGVRAED